MTEVEKNERASNETVDQLIQKLIDNLNSVIVGAPETIKLLVCSFIASGHVLLEDRPGVGKTALAKALASSLSVGFNRLQFTSDLMPSDVTGSLIWKPQNGDLEFRKGPIFTNILLGDELNRASPRVQSALLEAMNESHISIDGNTHILEDPFFFIATQNPFDDAGCYPLPNAQLDRFMVRLEMGYPESVSEINLLNARLKSESIPRLKSVVSSEQAMSLRSVIERIKIDESLIKWLVNFANTSREDRDCNHGLSPRALLHMCAMVRALALTEKRQWVEPEDIECLLVPVFAHRVSTRVRSSSFSKIEDQTAQLDTWLANCPLPV